MQRNHNQTRQLLYLTYILLKYTLTVHERLLLGGDPAFDLRQVARRAGTGLDLAQRFWQAMGFADVDPDAVRFIERDVEALSGVADLIDESDDGSPSPSAPGGGLAASSVLELRSSDLS